MQVERDSNKLEQLLRLREEWGACERCPLGCRARHHVVLGDVVTEATSHETNMKASGSITRRLNRGITRVDVLIVGEGPGEAEDVLGKAFVGPSGRLLRKTVARADHSELIVAYNNLVACRPQDKRYGSNRAPDPAEIDACKPRLQELIRIYRPRAIIAAGAVPADFLQRIVMESGWGGEILSMPHPAYILRDGGEESPEYPRYLGRISDLFNRLRNVGKKKKETADEGEEKAADHTGGKQRALGRANVLKGSADGTPGTGYDRQTKQWCEELTDLLGKAS